MNWRGSFCNHKICFELEHENVAKLLIDNKADVNAKNARGETQLHVCAIDGIVFFYTRSEWNFSIYLHQILILFNFKLGNESVAKLLIDSGADLNAKDNDDYTPLFCAILFRKFFHIYYWIWSLLKKFRFLCILWKGRQENVAKLLIECGADVNLKNPSGDMPIHHAAEFGINWFELQLIQFQCCSAHFIIVFYFFYFNFRSHKHS